MMASFAMETFSALLFLYEGNPPVIREIFHKSDDAHVTLL